MNIPEDALDAIEAVMNTEFNAGVSSVEAVEVGAAHPEVDTPDLIIDNQGRTRTPDGKFASLKDAVPGSAQADIPTDVGIGQEAEHGEEEVRQESPEATDQADLDWTEEKEPEEAPSEEEDAYVLELEEDILDLVESKYGGDINKALASLREAQSLIGRQGNELGELRELKEQFGQLQNFLLMQQQAQQVDWDEIIMDDPEAAVRLAAQYQNQDAFETALEAWAVESPVKVFAFLQEATQAQQKEPETTLEAEMEAFKQRHPDVLDKMPSIQEEARKRPVLAAMLQSGDPRARAEALEDLYDLASSRTSASETSKAARTIILKAQAEAEAAKKEASVVSASNTSAAAAAPVNANEALQQALRDLSGLDDLVIV